MRLLVLLALVVATLSTHPHNSSDVSSHRDAGLTQFQNCGETIITNGTYFVNPSFPNTDSTPVNPCRTRVDLIGENVCQLRLDFRSFSLAQPTAKTSFCDTDIFRIIGTTNDASIPTICGENSGQHLYVDLDPTSRGPTLEVDTQNTAGTTFSRRWAIEVTQIQCDSVERAPKGCRQFYNTTSGTVKSFNFKEPPSTVAEINAAVGLQLHLANQNYQVCIMQQTEFCSIRWTPTTATATTHTFVMTGAYVGAGAAVGTTNAWVDAYTGAQAGAAAPDPTTPCADYVVIPGGSYAALVGPPAIAAGQSDRYCGGYFPTVTSTSMPFGLHVKTDGTEPAATETANIGFSLNYRMQSTGC